MCLSYLPLSTLSFSRLAAIWPAQTPLICLAGSGRFAVIATHFREVSWEDAARTPLAVPKATSLAFSRGLIGVLSYDQFDPLGGRAKPRIFRVEAALVHDRARGLLYLPEGSAVEQPGDSYVDAEELARGLQGGSISASSGLTIDPLQTDDHYRRLVRTVIDDIRNGRYYQLNLLRYFKVRPVINREWIGCRLDHMNGAFGAWIEAPDLSLLSLSPERFLKLEGVGGEGRLEVRPIKGTMPRINGDPLHDALVAQQLLNSAKDRAELAMIVDLMRHDLFPVSKPGSIKVPSSGHLLSVGGVHHLEASIQSLMRLPLTLGDLMTTLCPGGSITGAPKHEVMTAIRSYEGRERGYFMGNIFYLDDSGGLDASILIRTMVGIGDGRYDYAAGSGLVIGSDPESERLEVAAKCRVLTEDFVCDSGKN